VGLVDDRTWFIAGRPTLPPSLAQPVRVCVENCLLWQEITGFSPLEIQLWILGQGACTSLEIDSSTRCVKSATKKRFVTKDVDITKKSPMKANRRECADYGESAEFRSH